MNVKISGVGCSLVDYLFTNISFTNNPFTEFTSLTDGDGGLSPGRLVFTEDFSAFTGIGFTDGLKTITGNRKPDAVNLGGPAIIALAHVAQMCSKDKVQISFYGAMGDDKTSHTLTEFLQGMEINLDNYITIPGSTPFTYVFSDPSYHDGKGERAFINNIGVCHDYKPDLVDDTFYDADILLFGGTAIVPGIHKNITAMLKRGREAGKLTVLATVYDFLNERNSPTERWPLGSGDETYGYIDLLVADMEEAARMSGATNQREAAKKFAVLGVGASVITNGAHDIHVQVNRDPFLSVQHLTMPVCTAVDEELEKCPHLAGDTTGCGDNFVGGILTSIAKQMSNRSENLFNLTDAVAWGAASGGFARFSLGGLYKESYVGEKLERVSLYRNLYKNQTSGY